jgi:hypothetical protein
MLNLIKHYAMKVYGGVDVQVSDQVQAQNALFQEERAPSTNWLGGWMDPRADPDDFERRNFLTLPGLELRILGRLARSQSLSRFPTVFSKGFITMFLTILSRCDLGFQSGTSCSRISDNAS